MRVFKNPIYKKRIILIIPSLVGGGTEKTLVNLANMFNANDYKVEIICIYEKNENQLKIPEQDFVIDLQQEIENQLKLAEQDFAIDL